MRVGTRHPKFRGILVLNRIAKINESNAILISRLSHQIGNFLKPIVLYVVQLRKIGNEQRVGRALIAIFVIAQPVRVGGKVDTHEMRC